MQFLSYIKVGNKIQANLFYNRSKAKFRIFQNDKLKLRWKFGSRIGYKVTKSPRCKLNCQKLPELNFVRGFPLNFKFQVKK